MGVCSFLHYGDREDARLVVRFHDDAERRWQLDHYMHLEPARDDRQWCFSTEDFCLAIGL